MKIKLTLGVHGSSRPVTIDAYVPYKDSPLCVHRRLGETGIPRDGWTITHIATGHRAYPRNFHLRNQALSVLDFIVPTHKAWRLIEPGKDSTAALATLRPILEECNRTLGANH